MNDNIFFTTCGHNRYMKKPEKLPSEMRYFKSYSGRSINIEPQEKTVKDFAAYVVEGHAFYPCVLDDKGGVFKTVNKRCFEAANILAFDLEKGNHSEEKIRDTLINAGLVPAFVYRTYSHRQGNNGDRNRIVYRLPYVIKNPSEYLLFGCLFWAIYEDIDTTCIDTARLFYGTINPIYYVNESAVLDVELFISLGLEALKRHKEQNFDLYHKIISKLTESSINCLIDEESGLPVVCCREGRLEFQENITKKQSRIHKESTNAAIEDKDIQANKELPRITIINWYDKAMIEPLFRELANGTGHFGYKKAIVMASNYRYIDADDVKEIFFSLLRDNGSRFSDINHTIEECAKIWSLPTAQANGGFGSRPLPYRYCGELPQDGYDYPLSFIRNVKKTIDLQRQKRVSEDLEEIFFTIDFEENPHGFLINGGMGLGKTYSFLNDGGEEKTFSIKRALDNRYGKPLKMAFLCSRKAAKTQNLENYTTTTENLYFLKEEDEVLPQLDGKKIVCLTYHKFIQMLEEGVIKNESFDIIVCDECHSLFDDSFASQMGKFLSWVIDYRGKVIWITANASYFQRCYNQFIELSQARKNEIRKLYEDDVKHHITRFDTNKIIYATTSTIDYFLFPAVAHASPQNRVLVYLKSALDCYKYYRWALQKGLRAAFYVSDYCDSTLTVKDELDEDVKAYLEENHLEVIPMNRVFEMKENERSKQNSERLKDALLKGENYPCDIDIIFTTDALRESVNIGPESNVQTIITDDYTEIGVLQKRGRVRADIEVLYIVPNRLGTERGLESQIERFEGSSTVRGLFQMTQQELAEEYGKQKQREKLHKGGPAYVLRFGSPSTEEAIYSPNKAAYVGLKARLEEFHQINPPDAEHNRLAAEKFGVLSSSGFVNTVYTEPARRVFIDASVSAIAEKYAGIPLIGEAQDKLVEECKPFLRNADGTKDFGLKLILDEMRKQGFEIKTGKVGKKHGLPVELLGRNFRYIVSRK